MVNCGKVRLTGTITIPEVEQARFRPLLDEHIRLTRLEPGCIRFDVTQDADDPQIFHVSELFEDHAAFEFHQARNAASAWGQQSGHLKRDFHKEVL